VVDANLIENRPGEAYLSDVKPQIKWMLITGGVLTLGGPFLGILLTVIGMIGAFHSLGDQGISDPAILAHHVGLTLWATMGGLVAAIIGMSMMVIAAVLHFTIRSSPPPFK
jgi:biopolymer transport protein ExbB/TolQ